MLWPSISSTFCSPIWPLWPAPPGELVKPLALNGAGSPLPVLGALKYAGTLSQKELAQLAGIGQPAMAQMLDRMVKEGLLERATDSVDRRKAMFSISQASNSMPQVKAQIDAGNAEIFSALGADERSSSRLEHRRN